MIQANKIFEQLWRIYTQQNPQAQKVYDLFTSRGEEVLNDHIAFRTFDDPKINIAVLSKVFLDSGYTLKGEYFFDEKKLFAQHFEHSSHENAPKVFISELKTKEFSDEIQEIINNCVYSIPKEKLQSNDLIYSGVLWGAVSFEKYEKLRKESEYAAWLYVNGFRANHFTVNVNALKSFKSLEEVNFFLKENGYILNSSGGEIKGSPKQLLEQSSIKAELYKQKFIEGEKKITGCYYEFALRYPEASGKLYNGFIAKSADKIFESTDLTE